MLDAIGNRCPTVWQRSEGLHLCIGTDNNDHIDGSKSPDIIVGLEGDDLLRGGTAMMCSRQEVATTNYLVTAETTTFREVLVWISETGIVVDDIIFGGFDDDFLSAGNGNDELYGGDGDDVLQGGSGTDYFDCGGGFDIVIGFDPAKGDTNANNCEDVIQRL